jgi:hypothetical protein
VILAYDVPIGKLLIPGSLQDPEHGISGLALYETMDVLSESFFAMTDCALARVAMLLVHSHCRVQIV